MALLCKVGVCLLLAFSVVPYEGFSQTPEQKDILHQVSVEKDIRWTEQRTRAESLAAFLGIPIRTETVDGGIMELQRFERGFPFYYSTENLNAARTISANRAWPGAGFGFSLTGATETLGVWDGGKVRDTHQEFGGRVILSDGASSLSQHSTHVAGTMIAAGVSPNRKGMSYQGNLRTYDWNSDLSEMAAAAAAGMRVSNHSYGYITGWRNNYFGDGKWAWFGDTTISNTKDFYFGFYSSSARDWDLVAAAAPHYLIVKSAGNDRGEGPSSQPVEHWVWINGAWALRTVAREVDGGPSGYDCLNHASLSKNVLSVGAVNDIVGGYTNPSDVVMSSFSAWGPTDDGRIKPDVVANGISLESTNSTGDNTYVSLSGTSMASPNASGSLGLLLQLRRNMATDNPYQASTLKGLVIHTADEAGANPGPDYVFGWGLMNTLKAAQVMRMDSAAGQNKIIRELVLSQGDTMEVLVQSDGAQPLRATISWTDPAGTPPSPSLDPATIMLVNDLDLRIVKGLTTYYPWVLDPANPASAAATGDNIRDNVEQVHVASPASGLYAVRISHQGPLSGGSQAVALIVTGGTFDPVITLTSPNGGENWPVGSSQTITWTSSGVAGNVRIDLSTNGGTSFSPLFANTANDGSENWTVSGSATASARIRILSVNDTTVADTSNANFTIVQPTITVSVPDGGETWTVGTSQNIQWTSSNLTGNVRIELSRDNGVTYAETLFVNTANDGTQAWSVTGPVTANARVRIASIAVPSVSDASNSSFSIVNPTITVTVPDGGETWTVGTSQNIQWSSSNLTGNVRIELSRDNGTTYPETLFVNTPNDGIQAWTVTGPVTVNGRVRIVSFAVPAVSDASNASFAIVDPVITVIAPDGGETWVTGTAHDIQWSSGNVTGNVKIELSRDGGTTYPEVLFANTNDDGTEQWTVTGPGTTGARIRVTSLDLPAASDVSNDTFAIVQPSISVTHPNGGETLVVGSSDSITWSSMYLTGEVRILLSRDGGVTFPETLAASALDDGMELWNVTGPAVSQARIRIESLDYPVVVDESDADVVLATAVITVITPDGGETLLLDSLVTIEWSSANVSGDVMIELSRDGGGTYDTLFTGTPNDGTEDWTVTAPTTSGAVLRISSVDDPAVTDVSNTPFAISAIAHFAVAQGWNMLSIPVTVPDPRRSTVFPSAASQAYGFSPAAGYTASDTMSYGKGYWLKFAAAEQFSVIGGGRLLDTIHVSAGWNMIGSITYDVPIDSIIQIPSGIVVSSYYGYEPPYVEKTTIVPARAYWVKVSQAGKLVLSKGTPQAVSRDWEGAGR